MSDYFSRLFVDPSFMGALLGSALTGVIAITVMVVQIRYQNKLLEREKYKEFYKYIKPFQLSFSFFVKTSEKVMNVERITFREIDQLNEQLKDFMQSINEVREEALLYDVYLQFYNTRSYVELALMTINDIEHFQELDEIDIKGLRVYITVLKKDERELFDKLTKIEGEIKGKNK